MTKNKGLKIFLISLLAILIIGSIIGTIFYFTKQTGLQDTKSLLKEEYTTYWADSTDDNFDYGFKGSVTGTPPSQLFDCSIFKGGLVHTSGGQNIGFNGGNLDGGAGCTSKQDFRGQEVVVLMDNDKNSRLSFGSYSATGIQDGLPHAYYFVPYTLEPNKYDVFVDGKTPINKIATGIVDTPNPAKVYVSAGGRSGANIYFIGYKAHFSCDLSSEEVWIQENFAQPASIKDLEFIPTKFCKETRPFVLRDIQQGETAIYPDPIPSFNRGETLQVPDGKIGVINYATYFVSGVNNKCAPNEANVKVAGKWVCSQVIKPVEITVQCQQDYDCPQPLKNTCPDYFKGCQNKKCAYDDTILDSVQCKNEVVTIIKQIQEVEKRTVVPIEGINIFTFSQNTNRQSFSIGDKIFTATPARYSCEFPDQDFLNAPSPSSNCWDTTITFGGKDYTVKDTETIKPSVTDGLISIQYFAGGKLTRGQYRKPEDWSNSFIFTINNQNALQLSIEDSTYILKGNEKKVNVQIKNNLPSGDVIIKIRQQAKQTNQFLPEQQIEQKLNAGENNVNFGIDTNNLGINQISVQVFYKINADSEVLIPSDKFILSYNVVEELPSVTKIVEVEKIVEKTIEVEKEVVRGQTRTIEISKIPTYMWWVIGILVLFIVAGVSIYFITRKPKRKRK